MSNVSKIGVRLDINVMKIDKKRLRDSGEGKYLDATVFIDVDELDKRGRSGMITQDVSKEERDAGVKGAILGNCKVFWKKEEQSFSPPPAPAAPPQRPDFDFDDDIPF